MKDKPKYNTRQVVLLRHGESAWNEENLFAGWTDVDLSDHGGKEGREAGRGLKEHGFSFDIAFTSVLNGTICATRICLWRTMRVQTNAERKDVEMKMNQGLSVALLIVGILLIIWGVNVTESFSSDVSRFFTDSPTNKAIWLLIGGVGAASWTIRCVFRSQKG